jgi:LuxR family transcriptional regulator, maltose regulon positive regulatory protein
VSLASDTLVSTKLRPPEARPRLVARPRLTEKLERESGRRLTLVSAPAGFGKTTLLNEWLERHAAGERSVAWLSLDEGDNDPARFLSYLVAALRSVEEGVGEGVLSSLRSPEPPRIEALAGTLLNELASIPHKEWTIVLDDYHVIEAEPIHGIVSFLLDHLPEGAHLIIASRVDPPLSLSRLRARGQMAELRPAELRFSLEEVESFLADTMGLELAEKDVAALEKRTEGWIAGLHLAALSMRDRKDVSGFVRAFSGSHRDVLDFLASEVLERQPEPVREFLLKTSILDRLSGPLCDALTGASNGQTMLERLERDNLFVIPLDDDRHWYRYHHLFADFLRGRLQSEDSERVEELHRAAATWCERHGLIDDAVRHALGAGDPEWTARLVEQHVAGVLARSERATLEWWLAALPEEVVRSRPRLCLVLAYRAMLTGRLVEFERLLDDTERALIAAGRGAAEPATAMPTQPNWAAGLLTNVPGAIVSFRSELARLRGDADRTTELARHALARLNERDSVLRAMADWELARAHWMRGDLDEAQGAMSNSQWAEAAHHATDEPYIDLILSWDLGRVQSARGRLRAALRTYREALELDTRAGRRSPLAVGAAHVGLAEILREQDELDDAREHAAEGVELCEQLANRLPLASGLVTLARIRQARGDKVGALEAIEEAERVGLSQEVTDLFNPVPVQRARLLLVWGEVAEAARWTAERGLDAEDEVSYVREPEHLVLARVLLAEEKPEQALRLLERLRGEAEAAERAGSVIEILALQALALQDKTEKEGAVNALSRALSLANPEGYVRTFVDEGSQMLALLSEVLEVQQRGRLDLPVPSHYLRKLLAAIERGETLLAAGRPRSSGRLPEPLSEREMEVLVLIVTGKTNQNIASELFVAESTVKTHIKNIYHKLNVRSRTQALARARELNLI